MTIGVWQPRKKANLTKPNLERLAAALDGDQVVLTPDEAAVDVALMQLEPGGWQVTLTVFSLLALYHGVRKMPHMGLVTLWISFGCLIVRLVRFFTLAEMQLAGWEAGKQSPVIPLVKVLKGRGSFDAELRRWIKTHTDNRYLPYGSVL